MTCFKRKDSSLTGPFPNFSYRTKKEKETPQNKEKCLFYKRLIYVSFVNPKLQEA
jgi:hypothetical protein